MVQSFQNHFVKAELSTSCLLISDRHYPTRRGIHYDLRANPTSIVNAYIGGQFNGCGNSIIHSCKLQRGIFSRASNQNRGIRSKLSFNGHKLNQRVGANRKRFLLFAWYNIDYLKTSISSSSKDKIRPELRRLQLAYEFACHDHFLVHNLFNDLYIHITTPCFRRMDQVRMVLSRPLVISLDLSAVITMPVTEVLLLLRFSTIWFFTILYTDIFLS